MSIGVSIFLIAVGAIMYFAVSATVTGISIATVGVVLMIMGGVGLLLALATLSGGVRLSRGTRADAIQRETVIREDRVP